MTEEQEQQQEDKNKHIRPRERARGQKFFTRFALQSECCNHMAWLLLKSYRRQTPMTYLTDLNRRSKKITV